MIGIVDSGLGGLTTLATLALAGCDNNFCYYADTAAAPYGNKDKSTMLGLVYRACNVLVDMGADRIVLGCNTASIVALDYLRHRMPCPVDGVLPPVERAVAAGGSVLVLATRLSCEYLHERYPKVRTLAMPSLATLVDRHYPHEIPYIYGYLGDKLRIARQVDNLVLGCTHYLLVKEQICRIIRAKRTFDPNDDLVGRIQKSPQGRGICVHIVASGPIDEGRYTKVLQALMN